MHFVTKIKIFLLKYDINIILGFIYILYVYWTLVELNEIGFVGSGESPRREKREQLFSRRGRRGSCLPKIFLQYKNV